MTEPNPYDALARVLRLKPQQRRNLLRLEVWCERSKCTPIRIFALRDGLLVQCRSDADVRDMQEQQPHLDDWSRRRAFFLHGWLDTADPPPSHLQVVCDCLQTAPRLVDVRKLADLIPSADRPTRRVKLREVVASGV